MANSIDAATSYLTPRYGNPTVDCGGAQVRAQCRHLATVVTVNGTIDARNLDQMSEYCGRFVLPDQPIVLDLSRVDWVATQGIRFLYRIDDACRAAGIEWALIASPAVTRVLWITNDEFAFPVVDSVHEALHCFADLISVRRRLVLELVTKTA